MEDDDEDYEDWFDVEQWEDDQAFQKYKSSMPSGWRMLKLQRYTNDTLKEIDQWLEDNCSGKFKRIGWSSGCAYSVAVQFENDFDAAMFRLRGW